MEGVREVALAYYETLSDEEKQEYEDDFKQIVERRNVREYFKTSKLILEEPEIVDKCLNAFEESEEEEGRLDFNNFITLWHILDHHLVVICNECSSLILGKLFFSCYECFMDYDEEEGSYQLCCACYSSKKFQNHKHQTFHDSQALHNLSMRMIAQKKRDMEGRNKVIEKMMIESACDLMKKATSIKTEMDADLPLMNFDKNKKLDRVSRLAKQLKEKTILNEEKTERSEEEEDDDEDYEDLDDEENSTTVSQGLYRSVDIMGPRPSMI